jgi:hypothetical protein
MRGNGAVILVGSHPEIRIRRAVRVLIRADL